MGKKILSKLDGILNFIIGALIFVMTIFLLWVLLLGVSLNNVEAAPQPPTKPDVTLTPGVVDPNATVGKVCTPNYTTTVRNVPNSLKKKVFAEYNIDPKSDKFEIDHLISLELGGSNDIKNLWPQSYTTIPYNAHSKDALENKLHRMICEKKITMTEAQNEIVTDWITAYQKYVK